MGRGAPEGEKSENQQGRGESSEQRNFGTNLDSVALPCREDLCSISGLGICPRAPGGTTREVSPFSFFHLRVETPIS